MAGVIPRVKNPILIHSRNSTSVFLVLGFMLLMFAREASTKIFPSDF
jgi:hypothetical protein